MTANKNFKRLVRARMAKTGESYTTARMHLLAKRPPPSGDHASLASQEVAVKEASMEHQAASTDEILESLAPFFGGKKPSADVLNLTRLKLTDSSISDISPLAHLANLTELHLSGFGEVTDISPLASLTKLRKLNLRGFRRGTSVSPLVHLTNLTEVHLSSGFAGAVSISPSAQMLKRGWVVEYSLPSGHLGTRRRDHVGHQHPFAMLRHLGVALVMDGQDRTIGRWLVRRWRSLVGTRCFLANLFFAETRPAVERTVEEIRRHDEIPLLVMNGLCYDWEGWCEWRGTVEVPFVYMYGDYRQPSRGRAGNHTYVRMPGQGSLGLFHAMLAEVLRTAADEITDAAAMNLDPARVLAAAEGDGFWVGSDGLLRRPDGEVVEEGAGIP